MVGESAVFFCGEWRGGTLLVGLLGMSGYLYWLMVSVGHGAMCYISSRGLDGRV